MKIREMIEEESFKQYGDLAIRYAEKDLSLNEDSYTAGFELGALWAMRWWAERWNTKDELEGRHALTLTEQQKLYPALREMDAAAAEVLEGEKK